MLKNVVALGNDRIMYISLDKDLAVTVTEGETKFQNLSRNEAAQELRSVRRIRGSVE